MSRTLWPKVRVRVRACGRFLLLEPKTRMEASFFSEKNSSEEASSKGWMGFFFVNFLASGWRRACSSARASWATWLQVVPRRKRAVLGFSISLGDFFSRARLERAFRGFLDGGLGGLARGEGRRSLHLAQHFGGGGAAVDVRLGGYHRRFEVLAVDMLLPNLTV